MAMALNDWVLWELVVDEFSEKLETVLQTLFGKFEKEIERILDTVNLKTADPLGPADDVWEIDNIISKQSEDGSEADRSVRGGDIDSGQGGSRISLKSSIESDGDGDDYPSSKRRKMIQL